MSRQLPKQPQHRSTTLHFKPWTPAGRAAGVIIDDAAVTPKYVVGLMAIAFKEVANAPLYNQIGVLLTVAVLITALVYGFVALILKADDVGLHLAADKSRRLRALLGQFLGQFLVLRIRDHLCPSSCTLLVQQQMSSSNETSLN